MPRTARSRDGASNDGCGLHDRQDLAPARPDARKHHPEGAVNRPQARPTAEPLHRELLTEREVFGDQTRPGPEMPTSGLRRSLRGAQARPGPCRNSARLSAANLAFGSTTLPPPAVQNPRESLRNEFLATTAGVSTCAPLEPVQ